MVQKNKVRFFRNLVLIVLLGIALWGLGGFRLPTAELEFRRQERLRLADRSTVIWSFRERAKLHRANILVGLTDDAVLTYEYHSGHMTRWPQQEGGTIVVLPEEIPNLHHSVEFWDFAILIPDPPEGAVSARMTLLYGRSAPVRPEDDDLQTYLLKGTLADGMILLQPKRGFIPEDEDVRLWDLSQAIRFIGPSYGNLDGFPHTLEFFDAEGTLIRTVTNQ